MSHAASPKYKQSIRGLDVRCFASSFNFRLVKVVYIRAFVSLCLPNKAGPSDLCQSHSVQPANLPTCIVPAHGRDRSPCLIGIVCGHSMSQWRLLHLAQLLMVWRQCCTFAFPFLEFTKGVHGRCWTWLRSGMIFSDFCLTIVLLSFGLYTGWCSLPFQAETRPPMVTLVVNTWVLELFTADSFRPEMLC